MAPPPSSPEEIDSARRDKDHALTSRSTSGPISVGSSSSSLPRGLSSSSRRTDLNDDPPRCRRLRRAAALAIEDSDVGFARRNTIILDHFLVSSPPPAADAHRRQRRFHRIVHVVQQSNRRSNARSSVASSRFPRPAFTPSFGRGVIISAADPDKVDEDSNEDDEDATSACPRRPSCQ
jgi:hypothetical protein